MRRVDRDGVVLGHSRRPEGNPALAVTPQSGHGKIQGLAAALLLGLDRVEVEVPHVDRGGNLRRVVRGQQHPAPAARKLEAAAARPESEAVEPGLEGDRLAQHGMAGAEAQQGGAHGLVQGCHRGHCRRAARPRPKPASDLAAGGRDCGRARDCGGGGGESNERPPSPGGLSVLLRVSRRGRGQSPITGSSLSTSTRGAGLMASSETSPSTGFSPSTCWR